MSAGTTASMMPVRPPKENISRMATAKSMGVSKVMDPFHMVAM
jgi:hypothetical protein